MNYSRILDLATDIGYELSMCGAETFRVEDTISRILAAYGLKSDVFVIPNYLAVSIVPDGATPITQMRRIGFHGNDLDAVEKFNGLSRAICQRKPDPEEAAKWVEYVRGMRTAYPITAEYAGYFVGAGGFSLLFGGGFSDSLLSGICGILVGLVNRFFDKRHVNPFFRTIVASLVMALFAYAMGFAGICHSPDATVIGALMILVPGLLFTNAMRDIIYGDTNSGINRIVQVFLTAMAIALGTAVAWSVAEQLWDTPVSAPDIAYPIWANALFACIACTGFAVLFNIHGPGILLCGLGGALSWAVYLAIVRSGSSDIIAYFWSGLFASCYAEIMARIRKYPAISYLVVAIFPMIPGAGVYYTMNYAMQNEMAKFASQGMHTAAIAGILAVGILLGSSIARMVFERINKKA